MVMTQHGGMSSNSKLTDKKGEKKQLLYVITPLPPQMPAQLYHAGASVPGMDARHGAARGARPGLCGVCGGARRGALWRFSGVLGGSLCGVLRGAQTGPL